MIVRVRIVRGVMISILLVILWRSLIKIGVLLLGKLPVYLYPKYRKNYKESAQSAYNNGKPTNNTRSSPAPTNSINHASKTGYKKRTNAHAATAQYFNDIIYTSIFENIKESSLVSQCRADNYNFQ